MRALLRQVVTFARDPRGGNPAFALGVDAFPAEASLAAACALLRADVVAVVEGPEAPEPGLRFATAAGRHAGAGHAAMAAAHLALERRPGEAALVFRLDDGRRMAARRAGGRIALDWRALPHTVLPDAAALEAALGARPAAAFDAAFGAVAVFGSEAEVARLAPDMAATAALGRALIATAPGEASDIVIRVFAPHAGLPEDPVCGTAHRIVVPYWAARLERRAIHSRHLSPRGGDLYCTLGDGVVAIAGDTLETVAGTMVLAEAGSYVQS